MNLSLNNSNHKDSNKDLARIEPEPDHPQNRKAGSKASDLAHNLLKAAGQGKTGAGNLAGNTFKTLTHMADSTGKTLINAVGSTGQMAGLVFAGKLGRGQVPNYNFTELAQLFEVWLRQQKRGQVSAFTAQFEQEAVYLVRLKESGFLAGDYLFCFTGTNSEALGDFLAAQQAPSKGYTGRALVIEQWDVRRSSLEKDLSCFVWRDGVR
jgi:hypothetical protein